MIIKAKMRGAPPLYQLVQLAIQYAYEKKTMKADQIALLQDGVVAWSKKINIDPFQQQLLERIGWFLKKAETPKFKNRVEQFKAKGIDWKKFHRMGGNYGS